MAKQHTGMRVAAGVLDVFGVAAACICIVVLMLLMSSLYTWLHQDLTTTFAGISENITDAVIVDVNNNR